MQTNHRILRAAVAAVGLGLAAGAFAAPPASLGNTSWTLQAGDRAPVTLNITNQGGPGAPGASICQVLIGNLNDIAPVRGWYCAATGRVHLLHNNLGSNDAVRSFIGNVSSDASGQLSMAGTVAVDNASFGDLGETGFWAVRQ